LAGGTPANADPLLGILHPLGLVYRTFAPFTAAAIEGIVVPFAAGVGMLVYLRVLACDPQASLVGALAYASGGYVVAHAQHPPLIRTAAAIPWVLAALDGMVGTRQVVGLTMATALLIAGGHPQTVASSLLVVVSYAAITHPIRGARRPGAVVLGLTLGAALTTAQWLPALELISQSDRALGMLAPDVHRLSWPGAATLLAPFARDGAAGAASCGPIECTGYPGMLVWLATLLAVPLAVRDRRLAFWLATAAIGLVLAFGVGAGVAWSHGVRAPARMLLWWNLGTAVSAALALRRWPRESRGPAVLIASTVLAIVIFVGIGPTQRLVPLLLLTASAIGLLAHARVRTRATRWVVPVLVAIDVGGFAAARSWSSADDFHLDDATREIRHIRVENGTGTMGRGLVIPGLTFAPWAAALRVPVLHDFNVLTLRSLSRALYGGASPLADHLIVADPQILLPANRVLDLLRVTVVTVPETGGHAVWPELERAPERWTRVPEAEADGDRLTYRNRSALPVAWLVHVVDVADADTILRVIRGQELRFAAEVEALATEKIRGVMPGTPDAETVELVGYDDDDVRLHAIVRTGALLVTSELAYPGWQAIVDGRPTSIYTVNGGFRAVVLEPGRHVVHFRYRPVTQTVGLAVGAGAALVLLALGATSSMSTSSSAGVGATE
jgi:hypothetical protein